MPSIESLMATSRTYMRDHKRFFQSTVSRQDGSRTFQLPHPNVSPAGLNVYAVSGSSIYEGYPNGTPSASTFGYQLDERNGLLRLSSTITGGFPSGTYVNVEGYYFTWVTDEDLVFFVENTVAEHQYHRPEFLLSAVSDVEADAIALGSAVEALWSQLIEFARDIDISTPEAVSVPATQRYRQMEDLLFSPSGLVNKYKSKAAMLGIGLDKAEMFHLRRISRTTGRLVPVYKSREWDDAARPLRLFPPNPTNLPTTPPSDFIPARVVTGFAETPEAWYPDNGGSGTPNPEPEPEPGLFAIIVTPDTEDPYSYLFNVTDDPDHHVDWDYGDGTTVDDVLCSEVVEHTYDEAGNYTVTAYCHHETITTEVTVAPGPGYGMGQYGIVQPYGGYQ